MFNSFKNIIITFFKKYISLKNIFILSLTGFIGVVLDLVTLKFIISYFSGDKVVSLYFLQLDFDKFNPIIFLLFFIIFRLFFLLINSRILSLVISKFSKNISIEFYKKIKSLDYIHFRKRRPEEFYQFSEVYLKNSAEFYQTFITSFNEIFIFLSYFILVLVIDFKAGLFSYLFIILSVFLIRYKILSILEEFGRKRVFFENKMIQKFRNFIEGFKEFKLRDNGYDFINPTEEIIGRKKAHFYKVFFSTIPRHLIEAIVFIAFIISFSFLSSFNITQANFILIFLIVIRSLVNLNTSINIYQIYLYNKVSVDNLQYFLNESTTTDIKFLHNKPNKNFEDQNLNISIKNLILHNKLHFDDFDISFKENDIIVLRGNSGVGKSSIADLLCGMIDYKGIVTYNGKSKNPLKVDYLSSNFRIFNNSVLESIIGLNSKNKDFALKLIQKFELTNLLKVNLGDNGSEISAGQRVRVGLLSCLVSKPDLLIVDEGFMSLPDKLEASLLNEIIQLPFLKYILIITHRNNKFYNNCRILTLKNNKENKITINERI